MLLLSVPPTELLSELPSGTEPRDRVRIESAADAVSETSIVSLWEL